MKRKRQAAEKDFAGVNSVKTSSSTPPTGLEEARETHSAGENGSGLVNGNSTQQKASEKRQKKKRTMEAERREVSNAEDIFEVEARKKASIGTETLQAQVGPSGHSQMTDKAEERQQLKVGGKRNKKKEQLSVEGMQKSVGDEEHQNGAGKQHELSAKKKRKADLKKGVSVIQESRGKGDELHKKESESGRQKKKRRKKGKQRITNVAAAIGGVKQEGGGDQLSKVGLDKRPLSKSEMPAVTGIPVEGVALQKLAPKQSPLLEKMRARLQGGQFRMLNEQLYTSRGDDAFAAFQKDPVQFQHYHRGYQEQMAHWPKLPVEVAGEWLRQRDPSLVVADFGCGDARLAASIENKVFSLDLVAAKPGVIACNMARTPLKSSSVDVAVFCLSLMGTDYGSFLEEAHRVLVLGGWLLIAEVKSRFDPQNGGADPKAFIEALKSLGFRKERLNESNKMFVWWEFCKVGEKKGQRPAWPKLKACIYKRR